MPVPGFDVQILNPTTSEEVKPNELGDICIKGPLPPGTLQTIYNNDSRFLSAYWDQHKGYFSTGDAGFKDENGYVSVMTRTDDLINTAGHRLSTGSMEQAMGKHASVAECACIGVKDSLKGEVPIGFVVLNAGTSQEDQDAIPDQVIKLVRAEVGPVASFHQCLVVEALPKTRSGKVLRGIMKSMVEGEAYTVPGTIEDLAVLDVLEEDFKKVKLE